MKLRFKFAAAALVCVSLVGFAVAQTTHLKGIAHVALRVRDLERSRAFYATLGFEQAFEFSDAGKVTQSFIKINDQQFIELYPRTQDSQAIGLMHVCYGADDIKATRALYQEAGVHPTEVRKARAGNLLFILHDPEDQVVEFTQYLPGSLHAEDIGKHLGVGRIAEHLHEAMTPVNDRAGEARFFTEKLAFRFEGSPGRDYSLRVPGSPDFIGFLERKQNNSAQLVFAIRDAKKCLKALQVRNVPASKVGGSIIVRDLDGNRLIFKRQE